MDSGAGTGAAASVAQAAASAALRRVRLSLDPLAPLLDGLAVAPPADLLDPPLAADERAREQRRLLEADAITRTMTRDEYVEYAECRQTNFVGKNSKVDSANVSSRPSCAHAGCMA